MGGKEVGGIILDIIMMASCLAYISIVTTQASFLSSPTFLSLHLHL